MPKYKICPRCELNYIPEEEEYCGVCKAELKIGPQLQFAVDEEESSEQLCPICKSCYIPVGEEMCESCSKHSLYSEEKDVDSEQDEGWREFLDDDEKDEMLDKEHGEELLSLNQLAEEEADTLFDDEEEEETDDEEMMETNDDEPDDFVIMPYNEEDYLEDEDEDEEDDEDEDEDDDF